MNISVCGKKSVPENRDLNSKKKKKEKIVIHIFFPELCSPNLRTDGCANDEQMYVLSMTFYYLVKKVADVIMTYLFLTYLKYLVDISHREAYGPVRV